MARSRSPAGRSERTAIPDESLRFRPVHDHLGPRLALVFGNQSPGGRCPYFTADRCQHCDIGAGEGAQFTLAENRERLAWFRSWYRPCWPEIAHLVLYNSGSVLNHRELPVEFLQEMLAFAQSLPALRAVSLDSREPYIRSGLLEQLVEWVGPASCVRPILGLESADDRVRNEFLRKQMPRAAVLRAFAQVGEAARRCGAGRVALDVNVVIGSPGVVGEHAINDAVETARFAWRRGRDSGIAVDLNIHPYYPTDRAMARFPDHPRCSPSVAARAVAAICKVRRELAADAGIFVGWQDEGHDLQQTLRSDELAVAQDAYDRFNRSQDPATLEPLIHIPGAHPR